MKGLTSHVLDTLNGRPASGVRVELWRIGAQGATTECLARARTDAQGRCALADELAAGEYELRFFIGEYFCESGAALDEPPFLSMVPVRFSIADSAAHYHIPLVASPWSYATYKGGMGGAGARQKPE